MWLIQFSLKRAFLFKCDDLYPKLSGVQQVKITLMIAIFNSLRFKFAIIYEILIASFQ